MTASNPISVRRALISVSDKTGIVDLARALHGRGIEILSTGGTARKLSENNISVVEVSDYTGFPEIMAGRVKTLHPKIHGGLLGRRGVDDAVMAENDIPAIDLLVVNLYPFEQTVAEPSCTLADAIEDIDIGGPALLRAAAKNFAALTVLVDVNDYPSVLAELDQAGTVSAATRQRLATKAFAHTARYDAAIANYLGAIAADAPTIDAGPVFPSTYSVQLRKAQTMRYGENPHQQAAFYVEHDAREASVATARQLQGKALSYNNVADSDAALECAKSFATESPACVIVKHANPCGVALGESLLEAYQRAYQTDPSSAFGGIIAFNQPLDAAAASAIIERQFVEVIIAPAVTEAAQNVLAAKPNVRLLAAGSWTSSTPKPSSGGPMVNHSGLDYKRVSGGLLLQTRDTGTVTASDITVKTQRQPSARERADLLFAWKVAKFVKSNAIVYARDAMTIGIGAGQMSRVYSARIAAIKAADENLQVTGSVMASDAFFPFRDAIDTAAQAGITAVIQPGGSMRDDDVIQAANEHNMAMVFTGMRHFRH